MTRGAANAIRFFRERGFSPLAVPPWLQIQMSDVQYQRGRSAVSAMFFSTGSRRSQTPFRLPGLDT